MRATTSLTTEESPTACSSRGGILPPTESTAEEQHDGGEEHGGPCAPGEAECVLADVGGETDVAEFVAGFDEGCAGGMLVRALEGRGGDFVGKGGS
jgi:hypothetical protein